MTTDWRWEQRKRVAASAVLWVLAVLAILAMAASGGCMKPTEPKQEPGPAPITDTQVEDKPEPLSMSVKADASLLATLHEMIGDGGRLVIDPEQSIVVRRPAATLTIKPGTEVQYKLTDSGGTITFTDPRPKIEAKVWGLRVSPELARLDLSPDNTGTAHVDTGPITIKRRFALSWEDAAGAGPEPSADTRPVLRMYSTDPCLYCDLADTAFEQAGTLPFVVEKIATTGGEVPQWVEAYPTFHWQGADGWRQLVGWPGLDKFLAVWKRSQD